MAILDPITKKNVNLWLEGPYDQETKNSIRKLISENPKELIDAFYQNLSFGTAGLRGVMGVGANRINSYTISFASQGLANYLKLEAKENYSVFISYDSRHHSREFAEVAAKVLAGNGIKVYLTKEMRPTPLVSFGCRLKKCEAAVMVTASHNPSEYNGYKVYWNDGGQVSAPHDAGIIQEVNKITSPAMVKSVTDIGHPLIEPVGDEIDNAYLDTIEKLRNYQKNESSLKIVYTSLHGTGMTLVPQALSRWGFDNIEYVEQQIVPDGSFPTTPSPNPEEKEALKMGIERLKQLTADILIATDPDADRLGVAIKHKEEVIILNGNQIACLCLEHICETLSQQNQMTPKASFVKSIVTTELFRRIAEAYNCSCFDVLTGFKYIARLIKDWEENPSKGYRYIFGGEESYGYMLGTQTRDKDAVVAAALVCEVASKAKVQRKTLLDVLHGIYQKYGLFYDKTFSIKFEESKQGKEKMQHSMHQIRNHYPRQLNGFDVVSVDDYDRLMRVNLQTEKSEPLQSLKSDILIFWLLDSSKVVVRPSGTEPKIKIYCGVVQSKLEDFNYAVRQCEKHSEALFNSIQKIIEGY